MDSYSETLTALGKRARALRMLLELQQREVAARAGTGLGTVVRFERTGKASLENVLRIATALGADGGFDGLFAPPKYRTLDDALASPPQRQRIRKRR